MIRIIILIIAIGLAFSYDAFSCSCVVESNIDSAYNRAPVIFLGRVDRIKQENFYNNQEYQTATVFVNFHVLESYKGAKMNSIPLTIINSQSNCDFDFEEGKEYMVFGYYGGCSFIFTDYCTRTALAEEFDKDDWKRLRYLAANTKGLEERHVSFFDPNNPASIDQIDYAIQYLKAENKELQNDKVLLEYILLGLGLIVLGLAVVIIKIKTSR